MKILVTGATGFLGSHVCRRLVAEGHQVRAFTRHSSNRSLLNGLPVEYAEGDVTNPSAVQEAVRECQAVIHAAARVLNWPPWAARETATNVLGTQNVVQACRQSSCRLLQVSSVVAIGIPGPGAKPANENTQFRLESPALTYALSKHRAELSVLEGVKNGLDAVIVNPSTIFGPHGQGYRGWEMLDKVRRRPITFYFTGGLCIVHVDDVVSGLLAALTRGATGYRYILGGENVTYLDLVSRAAAAFGVRRRFVPAGPVITLPLALALEGAGRLIRRRPPIGMATHYYAHRFHYYDSDKARRELGYHFRPLDDILREAIELMGHGKMSS